MKEKKAYKIKAFISGKVSGMPYLVAYGKFCNAERLLYQMGYEVVNPTRLCKKRWSWLRCMIVCLWHLTWCDCVWQLDNWQDSKGARIEYRWSKFLGKSIRELR